MNAEVEIKSALHSALAAAFPDIEGATKDSTNPHFKSQYADLASVVAAIKPALIKQGLFFTQGTEPSEGGVIVETMVHHSSGESMSFGKLFVPANKNDAQGFGSALTYARRYSLMTAFGVAPEDDDGNAAVKATREGRIPTNEPAAREKLDGPHTSKTALKDAVTKVVREAQKAESFEVLEAVKAEHKRTINQALRDWPELIEGDPNVEEDVGLKGVIAQRLTELATVAESASYQLLVSTLMECTTRPELDTWTTKNMALVDILSDEELRKFEEKYDAAEATILAAAPLGAG